jgi:hypothetical protein
MSTHRATKGGWLDHRVLTTVFMLPLLVFSGCTRTVIGGYCDSPNQKYRVYVRVYGPYGRSFLETNRKTVRVTVADTRAKGATLLDQQYSVIGYDVASRVHWNGSDEVSVVIYDYGASHDRWEAKTTSLPTNTLRSLTFHLDVGKRTFSETK